MKYLIDTWAWIEFFLETNIGKKIMKILDSEKNQIIISSVNVAEVYKFILREKDLRFAEKALDFMRERSFIIFVSTQIAVESAKLNNQLKIGLGDSLIYATALLNKATLVTEDEHFKKLKNILYIS